MKVKLIWGRIALGIGADILLFWVDCRVGQKIAADSPTRALVKRAGKGNAQMIRNKKATQVILSGFRFYKLNATSFTMMSSNVSRLRIRCVLPW